MKKILLLLIVLGFAGQSWGQETFKVNDTITLLHTIPIINKLTDMPYVNTGDTTNLKIDANSLKRGFKYIISNIDNDSNKVTLQPLNFKVYNKARIVRRG